MQSSLLYILLLNSKHIKISIYLSRLVNSINFIAFWASSFDGYNITSSVLLLFLFMFLEQKQPDNRRF